MRKGVNGWYIRFIVNMGGVMLFISKSAELMIIVPHFILALMNNAHYNVAQINKIGISIGDFIFPKFHDFIL